MDNKEIPDSRLAPASGMTESEAVMAINDPSARGAARWPRALARINGVDVAVERFEVDNNLFHAADTFQLAVPASALPSGASLADLFGTQDLMVELFAGFPPDPTSFSASDLASLILGRADQVQWDLSGTLVEISGRDLSSALIDARSVAKYPNQVSSAVVTKIAQAHGLTPVVTATTTLIGRYYEIDHVRSQDDRTEWDLVTWLAREEGFVAFVEGRSLYFQPAPDASQDPYVFAWSAGPPASVNATGAKVTHAKTLARDVVVEVRSWNRKQARAFTATARATHVAGSGGTAQTYAYVIPNLDKAQAQARARQLLAEASRHEIRVEIEGPADDILRRTDVIRLTGTGTAADGLYFPLSIVRSMSLEDGYAWTIEANNQTPITESVT